MCGIFAVAAKAGVDPDLLWFGTHRVRHRGPDDWGLVSLAPMSARYPACQVWRAPEQRSVASKYHVGLGSRRLSILDLSKAGQQPMTLPGSGLWIAFNGEIYNYREIRAALSGQHQFSSGSDTEVLLAAYQTWGSDCLVRLNGMFAFVVFDSVRMRLFLARDRFGEKPLYYFQGRDCFICASELKQFLEDPEFDPEIDRSAFADFFLFSVQDHDDRSFFRRVKQLRSAHWMEVDLATFQSRRPVRYWTPQIADDTDCSCDADLDRSLMPLLIDSVQLRLRSDVPVGVCLSGGIDSSAICAIAASQHTGSSLTAYTIAFPGYTHDEQKVACKVARHAGIRHQVLSMTAAEMWKDLETFVHFQDGPVGGASILASWRVFQAARADGVTVLLNGQGSDELFAGYNKFSFFWWQILLRRRDWLPLWSSLSRYFAGNGLANWNFLTARKYFPPFLRKRTGGIQDFVLPEFCRWATPGLDIGSGESLNARLWKDLAEFSLPCLLHWEDRNSMSVGAEMRLPFLDYRIVEAVLKTSVRTKLNAGYSKFLLRKTMASHLPAGVCWQRVKRGFETPAQTWFKTDLAPQIDEVLHSVDSPLAEWFNLPALREQLQKSHTAGRPSLSEFDWFKLVTAHIWLNQLRGVPRATELSLAAQ